jgi:hypothetical protein
MELVRHPDTPMKTARAPAIIFGLLLIAYIGLLAGTVSMLPPRMATHFDASGHPNGWMSRSSAVIFQGVIGLLLPLIFAAAFGLLRFVPLQGISLPNRDFWFGPERRGETCAYLSRQGLWFASLLVVLQGIVWCQVIEANAQTIPQLSSSWFWVTFGIFGAALIIWVLRLFSHFRKAF